MSALPDGHSDGGGSQWEAVKARYGLLVAVAGRGRSDSGNEWLPAFEAGPATEAELSRPHFAMADASGTIYVADKEAHGIRAVSPAGIITTVAGTNVPGDGPDAPGPALGRAIGNPNGLFAREDGTLYIVDLDNRKIRKVTPGPDRVMSTLFEDPEGFGTGRGLHVEPDESEVYYAAGSAVKRWTRRGGVEVYARRPFVDLGMVVKDRRGRLLVADRGANQVFAVTRQGDGPAVIVPVAGNGDRSSGPALDGKRALETSFAGVRAVWPAFDTDGFFIGTHEGCQVFYVDGAGVAHLFLDGARNAHAGDGEPFDSPGAKVSELRSISVDGRGNVIVVENDRGFVRMVRRR